MDDGSLLSGMADKHIAYYNQRGLEDKIFLMTTYLSLYYYTFSGTIPLPTSWYRLPKNFWNNDTLLEMGKKNAPVPNVKALVFAPNYIEDRFTQCQRSRPRGPKGVYLGPDYCSPQKEGLEDLREQVIQEHIDGMGFEDGITNDLTGKAKCVYNKMIDNNNNINWILKNFEDGDKPSKFNLIFKMSRTLGDETNASMATPKQSGIPNTFVISINFYRAETTNTALTIARTIIHEGIHARLWEFVYRNGGKVSSTDFPGVYEYMREYDKNWNHQQMADFYRKTIAKGLKQFDNGQRSNDFYNALAWEGLAEIKDKNGDDSRIYTEAWKKEPDKDVILDIIKEHKKNGSKECKE